MNVAEKTVLNVDEFQIEDLTIPINIERNLKCVHLRHPDKLTALEIRI